MTREQAVALSHAMNLIHCGWTVSEEKSAIEKTFSFESFIQAWGWMSVIAMHAEKNNHHPEWFNVYGVVRVKLTTHSTQRITEQDVLIAEIMDEEYNKVVGTK